MTNEEKRQQLKEQYKQDLKLRKEFLEKARNLQKQNKINQALGNMLEGFKDDSDDWIQKLNEDSALSEAKFEMALDAAAEREKQIEQMAKEAEMEKINALNMVEQMKREMGLLPDEPTEEPTTVEVSASDSVEETSQSETAEENPDTSEAPIDPVTRPKKTLGDF